MGRGIDEVIVPNLFIPGAPKCGTSSLHNLLVQHPEISEGDGKEPHLYNVDKKYLKRFDNSYPFSFYNFYSKSNKLANYFIDSSTTYLISPKALKRIKDDNPNAKFIVIGRDPILRIKSHYKWMCSLGFVERGFKEEIIHENGVPFDTRLGHWGNYKHYIQFSKYGEQIKELRVHFPVENILFVKYEELVNDTQKTLKVIWSFLDIIDMDLTLPKLNPTKKNVKGKSRLFSLKVKYNAKRVIKTLLFKKQAPWIFFPLKKIPDVTESELLFLKEYLEKDIKVFKSLGYNLNNWDYTEELFENK